MYSILFSNLQCRHQIQEVLSLDHLSEYVPLPVDVVKLMQKMEILIKLIYWQRETKPGSYAENIVRDHNTLWKRNLERKARPKEGVMDESDVEMGMVLGRLDVPRVSESGSRRASASSWP